MVNSPLGAALNGAVCLLNLKKLTGTVEPRLSLQRRVTSLPAITGSAGISMIKGRSEAHREQAHEQEHNEETEVQRLF